MKFPLQMKKIILAISFTCSAVMADINTEPLQASVKIDVYVIDSKGKPVEDAKVEFISDQKTILKAKSSDEDSRPLVSVIEKKKISITDSSGKAVVSCLGSWRSTTKNNSKKLIFVSGEFHIRPPTFEYERQAFRTLLLPQSAYKDKRARKLTLKLKSTNQALATLVAAKRVNPLVLYRIGNIPIEMHKKDAYGVMLINDGWEEDPSPRYILAIAKTRTVIDTRNLDIFKTMLKRIPKGSTIFEYGSCTVPRSWGLKTEHFKAYNNTFKELGLIISEQRRITCYCKETGK